MNGIVRESEKKNSKNIMKEKIWKRNCPECGDVIIHKSKKSVYEAKRLNNRCKKCYYKFVDTKGNKNGMWNAFLQRSNFRRFCPICGSEMIYSNRDSFVKAVKNNSCCKYPCSITKRDYQKIYTKERRAKMSKKAVERVKKLGLNNGMCPFFNKNACAFLDRLNEERGWNLIHALNGGEHEAIGFSLDGYDKDKNIIVEYDEPAHYNKNGYLKKRDTTRMEKLIRHLKCKFFRYNEITEVFKQYA